MISAGSKLVGWKTAVWLVAAVFGLLFVWSGTAVAAPIEFTVWDFEDQTTDPSTDLTGNAVAAGGSGLSSESFFAGNSSAYGWSFSNWALDTSGVLDADKYFEFLVDLTNYGGLTLSFDERRSGTGIRDFVVHYSTDGATFVPIPATETNVPDNTSWRSHTFDLGSGTAIDLDIRGESTVYFRIYGYNAEGSGGTWRIDNVTFTAATNPTAVSLAAMSTTTNNSQPSLMLLFLIPLAGTSLLLWRRYGTV